MKARSLTPLISRFGADIVKTSPYIIEPHMIEWRGKYHGSSPAVLYPETTQQVSEMIQIIKINNEHIITQGGNTGLCGGATSQAIPNLNNNTEYLLSTKRLNSIRNIDSINSSIIVEAGMTLKEVQDAAVSVNQHFPLSLSSEGTCTIGGNISTNAGGNLTIRYGNTRELCLGLEFVTPDGNIHSSLSGLRKDNTGYDLKQLMIGSEGTLGIITAASLKTYSIPKDKQTLFCQLSAVEKAVQLLQLVQDTNSGIASDLSQFELIPALGIEAVIQSIPTYRNPFHQNNIDSSNDWYVLMEFETYRDDIILPIERLLENALDKEIVKNVVVANDLTQASSLRGLRENLSTCTAIFGGSIKHDIALPITSISDFLNEASIIANQISPGCRPVPFGHLGDGNLHYNVSQPTTITTEEFMMKTDEMNNAIHEIVMKMGGSISAEHGIGILKVDELERYKNNEDLQMMRKIKDAIDPSNLLNPGRILRMK